MFDFFYSSPPPGGGGTISLIQAIPDQNISEDSSTVINLDTYFDNADSYSIVSGPAWATIDGKALRLNPPAGANLSSPFSVTVRGEDLLTNTADDTLNIDVSIALSGKQPYADLIHGMAVSSSTTPGHKFWCWDDPHGRASTHANIHKMERQTIYERNTAPKSTRWKANLPGLGTHAAESVTRNASVTTGDATVPRPTKEAQDFAEGVLNQGLGRGEVGLMIQNFGSGSIGTAEPFYSFVFRSVLDMPDARTSDGAEVTLLNPGVDDGLVTFDNEPVGFSENYSGLDSFFTANGVEYWSGWMTAFCTEWLRLQREDPAYTTLPDITAFWFDTEVGFQINNVIKNWSSMWADSRATDASAIVGSPLTLRQIHEEIKSKLDPSDWLPETGGVPDDSTGLSYTSYPEWSIEASRWMANIESWAFKAVTDDEIFPIMPTVYVANWASSSDNQRRDDDLSSVNNGFYKPDANHGTHAGYIIYTAPIDSIETIAQDADVLHPSAPWVFGPHRWLSETGGDYDKTNNWQIDETGVVTSDDPLPAELQSKYTSLLGGTVHENRVACAEIYWREAMTRLRDTGVRHYCLWWNDQDEDGSAGAPVDISEQAGNMLADIYDELFSDVPSVPLARHLKPSITRVASGIPHWKIKNGIKSWTLRMDSNSRCILKINHTTYIGTYRHPEYALNVITALHIRLGGRAGTEAEQRALKALIDSKYVNEFPNG